MLYDKVNPSDLDQRLVMALKNVIVCDCAGKISTKSIAWREAIEKTRAFPPAKWERRFR